MIFSVIRTTVKQEKRLEFEQTVQGIEPLIINNDGCLELYIYQGCRDENSFIFLSKWSDEDKLKEHLRSDHFRALIGAMNFLSKTTDIEFHEVNEASENRLFYQALCHNNRKIMPDCNIITSDSNQVA